MSRQVNAKITTLIKAIKLTPTNQLVIVNVEPVTTTITTVTTTNTSTMTLSDIKITDEYGLYTSATLPPYRIIFEDFLVLYDRTNHDPINKFIHDILQAALSDDDITFCQSSFSPIRGDILFIKYSDNAYISVSNDDLEYIRGLQNINQSKSSNNCCCKWLFD
jgi:hypothetical protein